MRFFFSALVVFLVFFGLLFYFFVGVRGGSLVINTAIIAVVVAGVGALAQRIKLGRRA